MPDCFHIALAGNPNVGKSTVFNALTGLHQHTGNWTGKTVETAEGVFVHQEKTFVLTDLPGTYSLRASSAEEIVTRNHICFAKPDAVVIVCDACCLERNLNLAFQIMEITDKVIICVNLLDEARKKQIAVNLSALHDLLKVPVIGMSARDGMGIPELKSALAELVSQENVPRGTLFHVDYDENLEPYLKILTDLLNPYLADIPSRWASLRFLEQDTAVTELLPLQNAPAHVFRHIAEVQETLANSGWNPDKIQDSIISSLMHKAENVSRGTFSQQSDSDKRDRAIDRILLSRKFGIPIMLLLLMIILWFTMIGANYPSQLLSELLFGFGDILRSGLMQIHTPDLLIQILIDGVYQTLAWVIGVMLPPMAVFFPLFTLLEDVGYLPRVAFQTDKFFQYAGTCGKQCLTMCQGLGCNACGVTGCRIIDSPRERMIAILTNVFLPCNGRFPLLISMIGMFFVTGTVLDSFLSAFLLMLFIITGILMTFVISKLLSKTLLKGLPSSFILELPPYRRPQIGKVIIRSLFDRTIFVLGRACAVAAPAGLLIWLLANLHLLMPISEFLNPFAKLFGLDGVILLAFVLGFPANEIVIPIMLMIYSAQGTLTEINDLDTIKGIFIMHGWTWHTALCTMLFSLMHFPCSTTVLTIWKETKSLKWTGFSVLLPTVCGLICCFIVNVISQCF